MTGKIVLSYMGNGCSIDRHAEIAEKGGAIGMVFITQWQNCYIKDKDSKKYNNNIPFVCVSLISNWEPLLSQILKGRTIVYLTSKQNSMEKINKGGILFFQIFFLVSFSFMIFISLYSLIRFIYLEKSVLGFPKYLMTISFFCK